MKTTIGVVLGLAIAAYSAFTAYQSHVEAASRCVSVQPICAPGKHAICICESDLSFKCQWVCASQ